MYILNYGVNNSHMTETKTFTLYRDAVKAYNDLDCGTWKAATVEKLEFSGVAGIKTVSNRLPKLYRFEQGVDNEKMLTAFLGL